MPTRADLLAVLGLDTRADDPATIKSQYRVLAKALHPDAGGDDVRFREVTDAYRSLLDGQADASSQQDDKQGPAMHARWSASRRHTPSEYPAWFTPPPAAGQKSELHSGLGRLGWHRGATAALCWLRRLR